MMEAAIRSQLGRQVKFSHGLLENNLCKWILFGIVLTLIFTTIYPNSIYIRVYPQDIFGFLDGIHRTASGEVAHRDFSSLLGIMIYALPAVFVHLGAHPALSLAYAQAILLALNFLILVHLLNTRISGIPGLVFGVWGTLVLAARFNFGDDPQYVTFAMNYNRYCTVFLTNLLILFIPPRKENVGNIVIDVIVISVSISILFYSKITFFVVSVAALMLLSLTSGMNAIRAITAALVFLVTGTSIEMAFQFHKQYANDLIMVLQSSSNRRWLDYGGFLYLVMINLPELVLCVVIPLILLYLNKMLNMLTLAIFLFAASASLALIHESAQQRVLSLPFALIFITLYLMDQKIQPSTDEVSKRSFSSRGAVYAIMCWMWFEYSYPMIVNSVFSFASSSSTMKPISTETAIKGFVIDWRHADPQLLGDIIKGYGAPLDLFERTRASATGFPGMPLSAPEYALSLDYGFRAARAGCGAGARILNADIVNPFPAALDLPVGGGMIYIYADRTISGTSHPPADKMFSHITCFMVPKLPISYAARQLFLSIYKKYILENFSVSGEDNYWTVYKLNYPMDPPAPNTPRSQ
jgi:hypothetical protein